MSEAEYDKEQLRIMRNAFKAFDHDEKGIIVYSDVAEILQILGQKLDDKAVKALIKEVDKSNSGKLDFSQFCRLASRFVEAEEDTTNLASELKEAFRIYDREGKGYLPVQTLRDILHELDDKISNQDLDSIIEEIDADGSGTVDFDEFMQVMTGNNFIDFLLNRRFIFDTPSSTRCPCNAQRLRLHRRIEWHFERFYESLLCKPFEQLERYCEHIASKSSKSLNSKSDTKQSLPSPKKPTKVDTAKPITKTIATNTAKTTTTTTTTKTTTRCCRPIFRPRFPKWIPILTLYHEIVHNPLRCRPRYMIKHY